MRRIIPMAKIPKFQDDVHHKEQDVTGVVIANYAIDGKDVLDVRISDTSVIYETLAENWETIRTEEERI
jgi:hypothetical protein